jgi:hypothetical protein
VRAVWLDVNYGAVRSTGSLQLVDTDGSTAYLRSYYSIVELSRDLTISGLSDGAPPNPKCFSNAHIFFVLGIL